MQTVYAASNSLEAHMILNLLESQGVPGRIEGEYLQGGVGELPVAGLVRVVVDEKDYQAAKEIVNKWEAVQPAQSNYSLSSTPVNRFSIFLGGVAVGFLLALVIA